MTAKERRRKRSAGAKEEGSIASAHAFEPAYDAPCSKCGNIVTVSTLAVETCKTMNHIIKSMGEKLMTRADIAICRRCYLEHYDKLWAQERRNSTAYALIWANFRKAWMAAPDDKREMLEQKLRQGMGDYWGSYSALLAGWKAQMENKKARATSSAGKAGF